MQYDVHVLFLPSHLVPLLPVRFSRPAKQQDSSDWHRIVPKGREGKKKKSIEEKSDPSHFPHIHLSTFIIQQYKTTQSNLSSHKALLPLVRVT